jgi:hypothetical protein
MLASLRMTSRELAPESAALRSAMTHRAFCPRFAIAADPR